MQHGGTPGESRRPVSGLERLDDEDRELAALAPGYIPAHPMGAGSRELARPGPR